MEAARSVERRPQPRDMAPAPRASPATARPSTVAAVISTSGPGLKEGVRRRTPAPCRGRGHGSRTAAREGHVNQENGIVPEAQR